MHSADSAGSTLWEPWQPLIQQLVWVALIVILIVWQRNRLTSLLMGLTERIKDGPMAIVWKGIRIEFENQSRNVARLVPAGKEQRGKAKVRGSQELEETRTGLGATQHGVHLVHVVRPSTAPTQKYEIFVYLYRWPDHGFAETPRDLSDVEKAEFWLGDKFDPAGVTVRNRSDGIQHRIGLTTNAYGPVLCTCRVTFTNRDTAILSRYLDFESGRLLQKAVRRADDPDTEG